MLDQGLDVDLWRHQTLLKTNLLTRPPPPQYFAACRHAREQFQVELALVELIDMDGVNVLTRSGTAPALPRQGAFSDHTIRSDEVFVVPDTTKDARFARHPMVTSGLSIRFYAGAPLVYQRKLRLGSFCLFDTEPREFSRGDRAELTRMAEELVHILVQ